MAIERGLSCFLVHIDSLFITNCILGRNYIPWRLDCIIQEKIHWSRNIMLRLYTFLEKPMRLHVLQPAMDVLLSPHIPAFFNLPSLIRGLCTQGQWGTSFFAWAFTGFLFVFCGSPSSILFLGISFMHCPLYFSFIINKIGRCPPSLIHVIYIYTHTRT